MEECQIVNQKIAYCYNTFPDIMLTVPT